jgi:hypothetical protein
VNLKDEIRDKENKAKAKELRRKIYLSAKERLKNDPSYQAKLLEQKSRMKAFRAELSKKVKEKAKNKKLNSSDQELSLSEPEGSKGFGSKVNPFDLLMQTASDSTLRPLGEIISIDFRNKVKLDSQV